jgi:DNA-binding NtrC family response regulator
MNNQILIADDNHKLCRTLARSFTERGFTCHYSINSREAISKFLQEPIGVVILDIKLGEENGIEILKELKKLPKKCQVIILTAFGSIESAVESLKYGAFDYLQKPVTMEKLLPVVSNALKIVELSDENTRMRDKLVKHYAPIITQDPTVLKLLERVRTFAAFDFPIFIAGESGTGKELLADFIHLNSKRAANEIKKINCAAIPDSLLDNELFGHEKGAYTGADSQFKGVFERAHNGSLFLDEISDMPLATQARILRTIQNNEIRRIGGKDEIKVNVRFIAATNRSVASLVEKKLLREDLYYRLSAGIFHLPPLRERKGDIPILVNAFLKEFCQNTKKKLIVNDNVIDMFCDYDWPGNIRELRNLVNYACAVSSTNFVTLHDLPPYFKSIPEKKASDLIINSSEKELIKKVLNQANFNKKRAAQMLGISRTTLYTKMSRYNIVLKKAL